MTFFELTFNHNFLLCLTKKNKNKKGKSETIAELAHRHLKDENHTTTDEELRNAKVELTGVVEEDPYNLSKVDNTTVIPSINDEPESNSYYKDKDGDKDDDDNQKGNLPNPYEVLG